ncbi:type II toxin-antitoxin system VapC family toxin [Calothrix sp. UHCC 0171]|uniref:type II toxin-antitoxin system VapC family toxin n=1 Tax=Calothrix sp. UHCC 0171 TaxID=3110245 RepID=UPI002B21C3AA|nr:PIN domain-containing protein [Calothrix sp. UHCC 0171]MEA5570679.1 PIN domain-containing protein [Calothrix sp. UHCC 0171]
MRVRNKIFVDTLFVVALINQRDQYHQKASELADSLETHPLITTDAVLLEIGNALARNYKDEAVEIIEHFLTSDEVEIVRLNPEFFTQAFKLYKTHQDKAWGLVDCISFIVMKQSGITQALTFDQHFVQAGFQALMR